jgi:hypothetical protein
MDLNKHTRSVLAQLTKHNFIFETVSTNIYVALRDICLGAYCSITVDKLSSRNIPRKGDVLIGFYALEPIRFTLKVNELLPYYMHVCYGSKEPKPFEPIKHIIPANKFVFACTKENSDYMINMIGMQYNNIVMTNVDCDKINILCFYGHLQTEERKTLAVSQESLIYAFPNVRNRMAIKIQRQWRKSISDPSYLVCKSRLLRELKQMQ